MSRKKEVCTIIGVILLIAGVAALVYGLTIFNSLQDDVFNSFEKAFTGSSQKENQAVYISVAGGAGILAGLILLFANRKKKRKKRRR